MDPDMRLALLTAVVGFSALFALLLIHRRRQLELFERVAEIQAQESSPPA
jgi:hypothetical protein